MVSSAHPRQVAPGELERVRELVNSWLIPNDSRVPVDRFEDYAREHRIAACDRQALRELRDDLRVAIERAPGSDDRLNRWLERLDFRPMIEGGALRYRSGRGIAAELIAIVIDAVSSGHWGRVKACPDCRWTFFDHTRNASKRWCLMTAGDPSGRSCGSIAKVRRYRRRRRSIGAHADAGA